MKPHLRLHVTTRGTWWVGFHSPRDKWDSPLATTDEFGWSEFACLAASCRWRRWCSRYGFGPRRLLNGRSAV